MGRSLQKMKKGSSFLEAQNSSRAGKLHSRDSLVEFFKIMPKQIGRFSRERLYARSMIGDGMVKQ